MKGTIVKGIGGFYYVRTEDGSQLLECRARGIFRKDGIVPYVGDRVTVSLLEEEDGEKGVIDEIGERKNVFVRPPVANVDCFVIVMAAAKPAPNFLVLDQFLVMAEEQRTDIVLCFNKKDLAKEETLSALSEIYGGLYPLFFVSGKSGDGVDELKAALKGKQAALAGPSGVGKSTLLNRMLGNARMETGEISRKTSRGKHTTRHAELFAMDGADGADGGMLFDTPGFTSFDVLDAEEEELFFLFPEMAGLAGECRYDDCRHLKEPDCAVRKAVEEGEIHPSRYASYEEFIQLIRRKKKW